VLLAHGVLDGVGAQFGRQLLVDSIHRRAVQQGQAVVAGLQADLQRGFQDLRIAQVLLALAAGGGGFLRLVQWRALGGHGRVSGNGRGKGVAFSMVRSRCNTGL